MKLCETGQFKEAFDALDRIKGQLGVTKDLQSIAAYLIASAEAETPTPLFPFVGLPGDPRDKLVVEAHTDYWSRFINGDELPEESWREL